MRIQQANTQEHLTQILALQQLNLSKNIGADEKEKEGFVTVEHSPEVIKAMNSVHPHTNAIDNNKVVGYALSMHPDFGTQVPELITMFEKLNKLFPPLTSYMVMGQICIAKTHRGKGLFRKLYAFMLENLPDNTTHIITEVHITNTRSLQAHKAIGFIEMEVDSAFEKDWILMALHKKIPIQH